MQVYIRWMIRRDMSEVLEIENKCFEYAWNETDFIHMLQNRNCIGMVCEAEDLILGYMIYELHKDNITILNIAVDPKYQRQDIGQQMIDKLISKLSLQRRRKLIAEVRETNIDAQLFLKEMGFQARCINRNSYSDINEDGYIMEYSIKTDHADILELLKKRQYSSLLYE